MKRTINYLFAAITLFAAASCTKDIQPNELNEGQSELRTIELSFEDSGITKVGVSDRTPQWEAGDTIWISNGTSSEVKKLASEDITGNVAQISTTLEGTLYAVYPASAQNGVSAGKIGFKIPTSTDGAFGNAHIAVAEGTTSLTFKNVVSILKITTETATKLVNISSASAIAGEFKVTYSNVAVESGTNQSKSINIFSSATGEKYVAVPSGLAFSALEFTVVGNTNATDWATKKSTTNTATTGINTIYDLGSVSSWSLNYITNGSIWAKFSVEANKQVRFSKGNLYYDGSTWNFEDNQYDYRTYAAKHSCISGTKSNDGTPANHWGTFGWSTNNGTISYGMSTSTNSSHYSGNFKNWGANAIANGGNTADLWETLSSAEWTHLLSTRTVNGGTGEGKSYQRTTLTLSDNTTTVYGMIIAPDNYTGSLSVSTSWSNWQMMESAGCVFLPAAGFRWGMAAPYVVPQGYYWSSTPDGEQNAYVLRFDSSCFYPALKQQRSGGSSVRLVCAAQ